MWCAYCKKDQKEIILIQLMDGFSMYEENTNTDKISNQH